MDLKQLENSLTIQKGSPSWRVSPMHFREVENGLRPGAITLSPAWFQRGHENMDTSSLEVSHSLMKPRVTAWLKKSDHLSLLVGGILAVIQPDLYDIGQAALRMIGREPRLVYKGEHFPDILPHWKSPFNVMSIISNRQTPLHRDNGGRYSWMDILVTLGEYSGGIFKLPGTGMSFNYDPGTVIGLAGRVLQHGATSPGNRVCLAYYMRQNVIDYLELPPPGWTNLRDLL